MTPYTCIKPQCHPQKCSDCNCAISPTDDAAHVILELLNTFAVCGHGHPFEDGDSAIVDKARSWLQASPRATVVPQGYEHGMLTGNRVILDFDTQENADLWFDKFCDSYDASAQQMLANHAEAKR